MSSSRQPDWHREPYLPPSVVRPSAPARRRGVVVARVVLLVGMVVALVAVTAGFRVVG